MAVRVQVQLLLRRRAAVVAGVEGARRGRAREAGEGGEAAAAAGAAGRGVGAVAGGCGVRRRQRRRSSGRAGSKEIAVAGVGRAGGEEGARTRDGAVGAELGVAAGHLGRGESCCWLTWRWRLGGSVVGVGGGGGGLRFGTSRELRGTATAREPSERDGDAKLLCFGLLANFRMGGIGGGGTRFVHLGPPLFRKRGGGLV